jgi:hypothetical protein
MNIKLINTHTYILFSLHNGERKIAKESKAQEIIQAENLCQGRREGGVRTHGKKQK